MSINSLFGGGKKTDIYVSVSQSCGLEMIEFENGVVKAYAQSELEYDERRREVVDYQQLKDSLVEMFQMRNVNPVGANFHFSLPSVIFGTREKVQLMLSDEAINTIVLDGLDQSYIFRSKEPIPYWFDSTVSPNSDSRTIFYTAIQQDVVQTLSEIVLSLGGALVSVGSSLFSDIKGLFISGITEDQMRSDAVWCLMIVNNNGLQIIGMQGARIADYYESALPIKTYEGEEAYTEVVNEAQISLMSTTANSLVIISETDLVSAKLLAERLQFSGATICIEDNEFRDEPIMDLGLNVLAEDVLKVSLHAIGNLGAAGMLPVDVNFVTSSAKSQTQVATIKIGEYDVTPAMATIGAILLLLVIAVPMGIGYFTTNSLVAQKQEMSTSLDTQITSVEEEIKRYDNNTGLSKNINVINTIEGILRDNKSKIMAYTALGESIPKNLYLTYFITGDNGLVNIKGCANSVEDVYVFFRNLKDSLNSSNLRLSQLDLKTGSLDKIVANTASSIDDAPYVFEITNMSEEQMSAFLSNLVKKPDAENKEQAPAPGEKKEEEKK